MIHEYGHEPRRHRAEFFAKFIQCGAVGADHVDLQRGGVLREEGAVDRQDKIGAARVVHDHGFDAPAAIRKHRRTGGGRARVSADPERPGDRFGAGP